MEVEGVEEDRKLLYLRIVDVLLRVPILYCIDFLTSGLWLCLVAPSSPSPSNATLQDPFITAFFSWNLECANLWFRFDWDSYLVFSFLYYSCLLICLYLLVAETNHLFQVVIWGGPSLLLAISLLWAWTQTLETYDDHLKTSGSIHSVFRAVWRLAHALVASKLYVRSRSQSWPKLASSPLTVFSVRLTFFAPVLHSLLSQIFSVRVSGRLLLASFLPTILFEVFSFLSVLPAIYNGVRVFARSVEETGQNYGLHFVLVQHWTRLQVPVLLRVFWLSRMSTLLLFAVFNFNLTIVDVDLVEFGGRVRSATEYLLVRGCETFVALLGMAGMLASVGQAAGVLFQSFLNGGFQNLDQDDEDRNAGTLVALLFLILALQTGLTDLTPMKRLPKVFRNLWLLSMAMLHLVHAMTDQVLIRLSTTGLHNWRAHLRALLISSLLLVLPFLYIWFLWYQQELWNPWLTSVALFALEVVVKTSVSLKVYFLYLLDTRFRHGVPHLDDFVYMIRATGAILEFLFAILLLFNGVWILIFEQSGALRSVMIMIHAYCNIWQQAKEGWASFTRRWQAAKKLAGFQTPTADDLRDVVDVCSICYHDLVSPSAPVILTKCSHFFHRECLKKWLYMQDTCPMCHSPVLSTD